MILTQSLVESGLTDLEPVGTYFDEVELVNGPTGYGLGKKEHIDKLQERAKEVLVLGANYNTCAGSGHPCYHRISVSVTGDLYQKKS